MFVAHARANSDAAAELAKALEERGHVTFLAEWHIGPGSVFIHEYDKALRDCAGAVIVYGADAAADPMFQDVYAALVTESHHRGIPLVPLPTGAARLPSLLGIRVAIRFEPDDRRFDVKADALAAALRGEASPDARLHEQPAAPPRPRVDPGDPAFVIVYGDDEIGYARTLTEQLQRLALPVWSKLDIPVGGIPHHESRPRIVQALAVIVVMSPAAQDSTWAAGDIFDGLWHGRRFIPVLRNGMPLTMLAGHRFFDARSGRPLDHDVLGQLRVIHQAWLAGDAERAPEVRVPAPAPPRAPAVSDIGLRRLQTYLDDREWERADLQTTTLLLAAAGRAHSGWLGPADGAGLPGDLLSDVDAAWSQASGGSWGLNAQRAALADVPLRARKDFVAMSLALGWRRVPGEVVPVRYREFVRHADAGRAFFPTLRNPRHDREVGWYGMWSGTALAVHLQVRAWDG